MRSLPLLVLLLVSGCSFAMRTSVARLDETLRPNNPGRVEVFQQGKKPTGPYTELALLTVDGEGREEADAVRGFIKLAHKHGANGLIIDRPSNTKSGSEGSGEGSYVLLPNKRCVFRATAILLP